MFVLSWVLAPCGFTDQRQSFRETRCILHKRWSDKVGKRQPYYSIGFEERRLYQNEITRWRLSSSVTWVLKKETCFSETLSATYETTRCQNRRQHQYLIVLKVTCVRRLLITLMATLQASKRTFLPIFLITTVKLFCLFWSQPRHWFYPPPVLLQKLSNYAILQ
jgi:hypothetical protein